MPDHDHSYKQIFSHPHMVKDLLTGFVQEDWVKELDFTTLEKLNQSYITDDLRSRADDVVWRVRFRDSYLIDEGRYSEQDLTQRDNLVAQMIRIERKAFLMCSRWRLFLSNLA